MLDDLIVWWVGEESFDVMPNASNTDTGDLGARREDVTDERAVIAVQGPRARERLATVSPEAAAIGHFAVGGFEFGGASAESPAPGTPARTASSAPSRPRSPRRSGGRSIGAGVQPAGLGARDTLRLEAGLPLHGHELGPGITPLQAGLGWVVSWDKGPFRGREPWRPSASTGPWRRLRGLLAEGRRPPRAEDAVLRRR